MKSKKTKQNVMRPAGADFNAFRLYHIGVQTSSCHMGLRRNKALAPASLIGGYDDIKSTKEKRRNASGNNNSINNYMDHIQG
jgi:hypothetical protein